MMQEELATHQEERAVMEEPAHEQESAETVVLYDLGCYRVGMACGCMMTSLTVVKIPMPTLCSKNEKATDGHVGNSSECARPPDEWVTDKVNLFMVLGPEVLCIALARIIEAAVIVTHNTAL